ncbi:MAG: D-arabinono-1,4-lactone oxidase [Oceanococcus sp.]
MNIKRRDFLWQLAALSGAAATPSLALAKQRIVPWRNWSGAQSCIPAERVAPANEADLAEFVKNAAGVVRPVGSGHSFSPLVPTEGSIVSLARLSGLIEHDNDALQATFWGGTPMSMMGEPLKQLGQALPNQADIDYQTLAGALATATHGTGVNFESYSSQVKALRLVTADGELLDCDEQNNTDVFNAAKVSLGALGIVSRVKLQNRSAFRLKERMWLAKTEDLLDDIPNLVKDNQHWEMQVLTHSDYAASITLNETEDASTIGEVEGPDGGGEYVELIRKLDKYGSDLPRFRRGLMNLIAKTAEFEDRVGDSFQIYANVRDVRFNEMEYSVPAEHGPACLREILKAIDERQLRTWFPIEYRYVKADDIPISMFEGRDSCSISIHQHYEMSYHDYFSAIEKIFWKYGGRPHWGKLHSLGASHLQALYPRWEEFTKVRDQLDPGGRFLNAHLRRVFGVA